MSYVIGIPLLACLAVLQSAVVSQVRLLDGGPDLVLLAVVSWSLAEGWDEALLWGMIGGLLLDLFSGLPFGSSSIILTVIALLASLLEGRLWGSHAFMQLGVVLVASVIYQLYGLGVLLLTGRAVDFLLALTRVILPSAFANLVLCLPAVQIARSLRQTIHPPEVRI